MKLAMHALSWSDAAVESALPQLCGAQRIPYASDMAAIFLPSRIPPVLPTSGMTTSAACSSSTLRNPPLV